MRFMLACACCQRLCCRALSAACGGDAAAKRTAAAAPRPSPIPSIRQPPATITGAITFEGTPPAPQPITMDSDPYCEKQPAQHDRERRRRRWRRPAERVRLREGRPRQPRCSRCPSTPVVLDQKGCRYAPHVLGIQVGQTLEIVNSDDTLHNVHAMPQQNREFNMAQPLAGHEAHARVQHEGSDGAVQVRRAQLDERVRRRARSSVLRGDRPPTAASS